MVRLSFSIILFVFFASRSFAQTTLPDSAAIALTQRDTAQAIQLLEAFAARDTNQKLAPLADLRLAQLYQQSGNYQAAITKFNNALQVDLKDHSIWIMALDKKSVLYYGKMVSFKADVCVALSTLYKRCGDTTNALKYLDLADKDYLPTYGGCANGMIMYQTYLSLKYADLYLSMQDTARAINRLLQFFIRQENYSVDATQMLRTLLLKKYSAAEITREVNTQIAAATTVLEPGCRIPAIRVQFSLFGYVYSWPMYDNLNRTKKYLRDNRNIKLLMGKG